MQSNREAELPGRLVLWSIQAHEARQRLSLVEPERRAQVGEIKRARRRHDRHDPPSAKIEREISQSEVIEIAAESIESVLELRGRQPSCPREVHQRPLGLEGQQDARDQFAALQLLAETLPSRLAEEQTQVG
jgi:hypothetical protein